MGLEAGALRTATRYGSDGWRKTAWKSKWGFCLLPDSLQHTIIWKTVITVVRGHSRPPKDSLIQAELGEKPQVCQIAIRSEIKHAWIE